MTGPRWSTCTRRRHVSGLADAVGEAARAEPRAKEPSSFQSNETDGLEGESSEILHRMRQPVPETQVLPGKALRFALGTAEGARSNVWTVFGSKNSDDVYVGARDTLGVAKLSLHQSGKWRRALIENVALETLPPDVDRVINRWEVPEPFADGWLHAVTITIPVSSIQKEPKPLGKPKGGGTVSIYQPDLGSHQVRFDVLIKSVNAASINIENIHSEVGRIRLPSGGCVGVVATEFTALNDQAEADIENLRRRSRDHVIETIGAGGFCQYEKPTGAGRGYSNENGRPVIVDLGDLRE